MVHHQQDPGGLDTGPHTDAAGATVSAAVVEGAIAAEITPPGRGAVAIVRISGPSLAALHKPLFGRKLPAGMHHAAILGGDDEAIDQGLVLVFASPASFTGEDVLECQMHGNPLIVEQLLVRLTSLGVRHAEPGEFSRRAFASGKLNLTQAESIADMVAATSQAHLRAARASYGGVFAAKVDSLMAQTSEVRMLVEAAFDFADEDIDVIATYQLGERLERLVKDTATLLGECRTGVKLASGTRAVLAGAPNVGKSSIFNLLAGDDKAIVTDIAGTTRDLVQADIAAANIELTDTAGIRDKPDNTIEDIGIARSRTMLELADVAIHVATPDTAWLEHEPEQAQATLYVCNQIDRFDDTAIKTRTDTCPGQTCILTSCTTGEGIDELRTALSASAGAQGAAPFAARTRHVQALEACLKTLQTAQTLLPNPADTSQPDIDTSEEIGDVVMLAEELRQAHQLLGDITGQDTTPDAVLDDIFARFCIGK